MQNIYDVLMIFFYVNVNTTLRILRLALFQSTKYFGVEVILALLYPFAIFNALPYSTGTPFVVSLTIIYMPRATILFNMTSQTFWLRILISPSD